MLRIQSIIIVLGLLISGQVFSQKQIYQTNIYDNLTNRPIQGATCILIQKASRKMLGYGRSNGLGDLKIEADSLQDSILVWVYHKKYVDYQSQIIYDKKARFKDTIQLIPLSKVLQTVIVSANKAITMSGDTVTYIADSFKLPEGSSVEDLLKNLPGIQVSRDGTIKAQGKKVEKVLVDGDDFFGEDASVATKNLDASMIDKVEVIDAATKQSDASGSSDDKMKIINLKLKDEAKKGYFGKVEQGYSNTHRYNSFGMLNVFRDNTKVSTFYNADNMQSRMSWQDMRDLGMDNQNWVYDEDLDTWIQKDGDIGVGNTLQVIPQNFKAGGILSQKFMDGTGTLKARYNYNQSIYKGNQTSNSSSFFGENTQSSQSEGQIDATNSKNSALISFDKTIDSQQKIHLGLTANITKFDGYNTTDNTIFYDSVLVNQSRRTNPFENKNEDYAAVIEYERKFTKKGRLLDLKADYNFKNLSGNRLNIMDGWLYKNSDSSAQYLNQKTIVLNKSRNVKLSGNFMEPLFIKGFYAELGLNFVKSDYTSFFNTYSKNNIDNEYSNALPSLSNNYLYDLSAWSEQLKLNFKSKKIDWYIGMKFHQVFMGQDNLDSGKISFNRNYNYLLPTLNITWKYKRNSNLTFNVRKNVIAPQLAQIQPFVNNSNPQYIIHGNPNLSPGQYYNFSIRNNFWYAVSKTSLWSNFSFKLYENSIVDSTIIESNGVMNKYFTQVDGNTSANLNVWYGFTFKPLKMEVNPGFWINWNANKNYYNNQLMKTTNLWSGYYLQFSRNIDSTLESNLELNLNWNLSNSDNPNFQNTNNLTWSIGTKHKLRLPYKFRLVGELDYRILPSNAAYNDNQSFALLNASLERSFLKANALTLKFSCYDILGQNRAVQRSFYQNTISETISQALTRYFMLTAVYKFKNKTKQSENDSEF